MSKTIPSASTTRNDALSIRKSSRPKRDVTHKGKSENKYQKDGDKAEKPLVASSSKHIDKGHDESNNLLVTAEVHVSSGESPTQETSRKRGRPDKAKTADFTVTEFPSAFLSEIESKIEPIDDELPKKRIRHPPKKFIDEGYVIGTARYIKTGSDTSSPKKGGRSTQTQLLDSQNLDKTAVHDDSIDVLDTPSTTPKVRTPRKRRVLPSFGEDEHSEEEDETDKELKSSKSRGRPQKSISDIIEDIDSDTQRTRSKPKQTVETNSDKDDGVSTVCESVRKSGTPKSGRKAGQTDIKSFFKVEISEENSEKTKDKGGATPKSRVQPQKSPTNTPEDTSMNSPSRVSRRKAVPCRRYLEDHDTEDEERTEGQAATGKETQEKPALKRPGRTRSSSFREKLKVFDFHPTSDESDSIRSTSKLSDEDIFADSNSSKLKGKVRTAARKSITVQAEKETTENNQEKENIKNTEGNDSKTDQEKRKVGRPRKNAQLEAEKMEEAKRRRSHLRRSGRRVMSTEGEEEGESESQPITVADSGDDGKKDQSEAEPETQPKRRGRPKTVGSASTEAAEAITCCHCPTVFHSRTEIYRHMLKEHLREWHVDKPEGTVNIPRAIKVLGRIRCKDCKRDFRHSFYYNQHLEWCGREDERTECPECGRSVMSMWFKSHTVKHEKRRAELAAQRERDEARSAREAAGGDDDDDVQGEEGGVGETTAGGRTSQRQAAQRARKSFASFSLRYDTCDESGDDSSDEYRDPGDRSSESSDGDDPGHSSDDLGTPNRGRHRPRRAHRRVGSRLIPSIIPWTTAIPDSRRRHKELDSLSVLESWQPDSSQWQLMSPTAVDDYLPQRKVSAAFTVQQPARHENTKDPLTEVNPDDLETLTLYQVRQVKDGCMVYAGGPVWAQDWCSTPVAMDTDQYLAVYCHRDARQLTPMDTVTKGRALVQLWNCGRLTLHSPLQSDPKLEVVLAVDCGAIMELKWCPQGGWNKELKRLGLLAAATSSGKILIYSVPFISEISERSSDAVSVYKVAPCCTLGQTAQPDSPCFSLSWHISKDQTQLAAGFSDGSVSVWSLSTDSPLTTLSAVDTDAVTRLPSQTFWCHQGAVTGLSFCPLTATHLASVSHDRTMKVWDLREPSRPSYTVSRSKLETVAMTTYWPMVLAAGDDCFSYGLNATHFYNVRPGEYNSKPLTNHASCVWSLCYNEWMHSLVACDNTGTVVTAILHMLHQSRLMHNMDVSKLRVPLMLTRQYPLPEGLTDVSEAEVKSDPGTSLDPDTNDAGLTMSDDAKTCLEYILYKNCDSFHIHQRKIPEIQRDDIGAKSVIRAMHRVTFNPNETSFTWYAAGGQAGVLFIRKLHYPNYCLPPRV